MLSDRHSTFFGDFRTPDATIRDFCCPFLLARSFTPGARYRNRARRQDLKVFRSRARTRVRFAGRRPTSVVRESALRRRFQAAPNRFWQGCGVRREGPWCCLLLLVPMTSTTVGPLAKDSHQRDDVCGEPRFERKRGRPSDTSNSSISSFLAAPASSIFLFDSRSRVTRNRTRTRPRLTSNLGKRTARRVSRPNRGVSYNNRQRRNESCKSRSRARVSRAQSSQRP